VGHTGTLDPFATGLLVLVLGSATRLARFVEAGTKVYRGEIALGSATDTDDSTGRPVGDRWTGPWPSESAVREALGALEGRQRQRPPAYSAKHVGGVRSHELARRGEPIGLEPVSVVVDSLELLAYAPPLVTIRATVGPGTYVRSLARDLGERLGIGAHLAVLRREKVGRFDVTDAIPLAELAGTERFIAPADLVGEMGRVALDPELVALVRHGRAVTAGPEPIAGFAALLDGATLVAVAEAQNGKWQPIVVPPAD
jgi:tRNA pseudouridine55 synthase